MNDPIELDWLARWATYTPNAVAIIDDELGRSWTYAELFTSSCRLAALLQQHGVTRHDRVAVLAGNDPRFIPLFFATSRLGATLVPLNFRLAPRELDLILRDAEPALLISSDACAASVERLEHTPARTLAFEALEPLAASATTRGSRRSKTKKLKRFEAPLDRSPDDFDPNLLVAGAGLHAGRVLQLLIRKQSERVTRWPRCCWFMLDVH